MAFYENQNTIQIHRNLPQKGTTKPFLTVDTSIIFDAMNALTGTEFKTYMYLLCNANGFYLDFSPQHIGKTTGISRDSARSAFKTMEDKGYIVERKKGSYDFYDIPRPAPQVKEPQTTALAADPTPAPQDPVADPERTASGDAYSWKNIRTGISSRFEKKKPSVLQTYDLDEEIRKWDAEGWE